jgi:hypothetical protein
VARPLRNLTGFFVSPSIPVSSVVVLGGGVKAVAVLHVLA